MESIFIIIIDILINYLIFKNRFKYQWNKISNKFTFCLQIENPFRVLRNSKRWSLNFTETFSNYLKKKTQTLTSKIETERTKKIKTKHAHRNVFYKKIEISKNCDGRNAPTSKSVDKIRPATE